MNGSAEKYGSTRFLVEELRARRTVLDCEPGVVSWEISRDCRFWAFVSLQAPTYYPFIGISVPAVMRRVDTLQRRAGLRAQRIDWRCSPVFSFPIDATRHLDPGGAWEALPVFDASRGSPSLDLEFERDILEALLRAERVLIEQAGTLEAFAKFGQERLPRHPTMTYAIPVAYEMLGRWDEAEAYIGVCKNFYEGDEEPQIRAAYERFVQELQADRQ